MTQYAGERPSGRSQKVGPFTITVVSGAGSYSFTRPLFGKRYQLLLTPPNSSARFSFNAKDNDGDPMDAGSIGGGNSQYLLHDEIQYTAATTFNLVGASVDGAYLISLWLG